MKPKETKPPQIRPGTQAAKPVAKTQSMNLDLKELLPKLKKLWQKIAVHLSFMLIIIVLLVYLLVVWQIRGLATAEPAPEAELSAQSSANFPKIDKKAIDQIQSLEQNSPEVHSLFDTVRKNPFYE